MIAFLKQAELKPNMLCSLVYLMPVSHNENRDIFVSGLFLLPREYDCREDMIAARILLPQEYDCRENMIVAMEWSSTIPSELNGSVYHFRGICVNFFPIVIQ